MEKLKSNFTFKDGYEYLQQRGPITIHQKVFFLLGIASTCFYLLRLLKKFQAPSGTCDNILKMFII